MNPNQAFWMEERLIEFAGRADEPVFNHSISHV